jgi:hypothetical protein
MAHVKPLPATTTPLAFCAPVSPEVPLPAYQQAEPAVVDQRLHPVGNQDLAAAVFVQ